MTGIVAPPIKRGQLIILSAIALAALAVRFAYVGIAKVDDPLRGDAWQYFCYAWNLVKHGTFSLAKPMAEAVMPDSFRDPGYPVFLASLMAILGTGPGVYTALLVTQSLLGAATVGFCMSLARRWMGFGAACAVGILLAAWPHLVSFAGYVLSETLTGFLLVTGLWLLDTALRAPSRRVAVGAGLAFAAAALTNAVVLPMAPLLSLLMIWRDTRRRALWVGVLLACLVPPALWMARSASLPSSASSSGRAAMNFVQGSWPEYHAAAFAAAQLDDPEAKAVMARIDREASALQAYVHTGWALMSQRLDTEPARYARWYAGKPALLWGWDVGVGQGDIYVFPTFHSLFEENPIFHAWAGVCFALNPLLALLALVGTVYAACFSTTPVALRWAAGMAVMATLVFCVLQAEPRYAVPYRALEVLLATFAVVSLRRSWEHRHHSVSA